MVAGPTGAAIRKLLGGGALLALVFALLLWTLAPVFAAARRFRHLDL
jgi:hypothetical protein